MLIKAQAGGPNATYRADNGGGGRVTVVILKSVTCTCTYLHERQVAWQVKYASGKVLGIVLSMPPLNFSFRS